MTASSVTLLIHGVGASSWEALLRATEAGYEKLGLHRAAEREYLPDCPNLALSRYGAWSLVVRDEKGIHHSVVALPWADRRSRLSKIVGKAASVLLLIALLATATFAFQRQLTPHWITSFWHYCILYGAIAAYSYLVYALLLRKPGRTFTLLPRLLMFALPILPWLLSVFVKGTWLWIPMGLLVAVLWAIAGTIIIRCLAEASWRWRITLGALVIALATLTSTTIRYARRVAIYEGKVSNLAVADDESYLKGASRHYFETPNDVRHPAIQKTEKTPTTAFPVIGSGNGAPSQLSIQEIPQQTSVGVHNDFCRFILGREQAPKASTGLITLLPNNTAAARTAGPITPSRPFKGAVKQPTKYSVGVSKDVNGNSTVLPRKRLDARSLRDAEQQAKVKDLLREAQDNCRWISANYNPQLSGTQTEFRDVWQQAQKSGLDDSENVTGSEFFPTLIVALFCLGLCLLIWQFQWILDLALDVLHYVGNQEHRLDLISSLAKTIRWAHQEAPDARIIVVGHSLGSVVAAEAVDSLRSEPCGQDLCLVTLGSPLNYLGRTFPSEVKTASALRQSIPPSVPWINLWRSLDFVGKALDLLCNNSTQYLVGRGGHLDYWSDELVWRAIARDALRTGDLARIDFSATRELCFLEEHLGTSVFVAIAALVLAGLAGWGLS